MRITSDLVEAEGVDVPKPRRRCRCRTDCDRSGRCRRQEELARLKGLVAGPHGVILTKQDMFDRDMPGRPEITFRFLRKGGPEQDLEAVLDLLRKLVIQSTGRTGRALSPARHRHALAAAASLRAAAACTWQQPRTAAEDYRRAADSLGRVTGQIDVEGQHLFQLLHWKIDRKSA